MVANNYELLRAFDALELLHGAAICDREGELIHSKTIVKALRAANREDLLRMAPLGWLDGRPVYGDSLLYNDYTGEYATGDQVLNFDALLSEGLLLWPNTQAEEEHVVEVYVDGQRVACANISTSVLNALLP